MDRELTDFQKIMLALSLGILAGIFIFVFIKYPYLPEKIPSHFNAAGEADAFGGKIGALIIPFAALFIFILMALCLVFPGMINIPVRITDQNRDRIYHIAKNMIMVLLPEILIMFFYIAYGMVSQKSLSPFFLPSFLAVLFGTLAFFMIKIFKARK